MHIRGRATHIDDDQVSEARYVQRSLCDQPGPVHDSGGCWHQHGVETGCGFIDAFGVDDPLDKDFTNRSAGRFNVEDIEFWHHVI